MRPPLKLTSAKNPTVKETADLLARRKERDASGLFVVEGAREIERALTAGFTLVRFFECAELGTEASRAVTMRVAKMVDVDRFDVNEIIFAKLAMREGSDGLLAVFKQQRRSLADAKLGANPLLLALHGLEKPGNLGALLRTADGVGVDAVVLLDDMVDLYNPHVVRGSVGALFGLQIVRATSDEFDAFCRRSNVNVVAAALAEGARPHYEADYTGGTAVLLGSEADGLPADWIKRASACVMIPMRGIADSLNVSVAGAVIMYEALRQRLNGRESGQT